ncbi:P-loop NTPase fold protein [Crocosphaera sp. XPORK-15E]|uniref:P-loop NTPase fold protein n=1 Tax=Crocosphaera sp. XPORK-15E TaxID=3110247 RepID=UPI002B1EEB5C|nr:P-loop NTPase fold protein [Crocosphaera sp. XPORK-15E]MEA5535711.1 P-loop NTPase fold protein [Crocosphaera sp. XPORK-15E]
MMSSNSTQSNLQGGRQQVKEVLDLFLNDNQLNVLAIKGKWGVGKTYFVEDFLKDFLKEANKGYYYASVFGLSSLEQLKAQTLAGYVSHENNAIVKKRVGNWWGLFNNKSSLMEKNTVTSDILIPNIGNFKLTGPMIMMASNLLLNLMFNKVKKSIICIHDLERKSSLKLDEILGFIEHLVQKQECKVILIYNEEHLLNDDTSTKALKEYREKVIDIEVELNPKVDENLCIIFQKDDPDIEVIQKTFNTANTNNIRIFKKIHWNLDKFRPLMENWEPKVRSQIIINIIVISLVKLDHSYGVSIDTVLTYTEYFSIHEKNVENSERIKERSKLWDCGYSNLEINTEIRNFIETYLLDENEFVSKGEVLNKKEVTGKILEKLDLIWQPYYNCFGDSETEISNRITQFLESHYLDISIEQFKTLEKLASVIKVDISSYKKPLLKHIIKITEPNDLESLRSRVNDFPDLLEFLESRITEYYASKDITTVLLGIVDKNSSSEEDREFLNRQTIDDYYKWLRVGHPKLCDMVKSYFYQGNLLSDNLKEAIKKLARESPLNAMRAKSLSIITDEPID